MELDFAGFANIEVFEVVVEKGRSEDAAAVAELLFEERHFLPFCFQQFFLLAVNDSSFRLKLVNSKHPQLLEVVFVWWELLVLETVEFSDI